MTKEELRDLIVREFMDEDGDICLSGLDFSDFDGNVDISFMKVKGDLYQNCQTVEGDLCQSFQEVGKDLYQRCQKVQGDLYQDCQKVEGDLFGHKLEKDEFWDDNSECVIRRPCLGNADTSINDEDLLDQCVSAIKKKPIEVDATSDENYYIVFMGKNRLLVSKSANSIKDLMDFFDTDIFIKRS